MNLEEVYDYIDLFLDKADQPYFTTEEKNKFLNLAISDFINMNYQKMTVDEDSRRALSGCIDWKRFTLSETEIVSENYIYESTGIMNILTQSYPALSLKYTDKGIPLDPTDLPGTTFTASTSDMTGYFLYGNEYVLPKQHLYVLSIGVKYYNKDEIIDPSTGKIYPDVSSADVVSSPTISVKNKSTRDYYEHTYTNDPFNKSGEDTPFWQYIENRISITNASAIRYINMQVITLPTVNEAFSASTHESSTAPIPRTFTEHHQKQIIELAVNRMTRVDEGLITPPS
jgi:hypothetical protein